MDKKMEPLRWVAGAELSTQARNELLPSSLAYGGCAPRTIHFVASEFKTFPLMGIPAWVLKPYQSKCGSPQPHTATVRRFMWGKRKRDHDATLTWIDYIMIYHYLVYFPIQI